MWGLECGKIIQVLYETVFKSYRHENGVKLWYDNFEVFRFSVPEDKMASSTCLLVKWWVETLNKEDVFLKLSWMYIYIYVYMKVSWHTASAFSNFAFMLLSSVISETNLWLDTVWVLHLWYRNWAISTWCSCGCINEMQEEKVCIIVTNCNCMMKIVIMMN